jgi:hypothetical protein
MTPNITKFNPKSTWDISFIEPSWQYKSRIRLNNGEKLPKDVLKWITEEVNNNTFFRDSIPVLGFRINFSDILKKYYVEFEMGQYTVKYGTSAKALAKALRIRTSKVHKQLK